MRRFAITGLVGLALAPLAWSSGALHVHEDTAFSDSVAASWQAWFSSDAEAERDLSGLLLVSNEHRQGTGHLIDLDELDGRLSDVELEDSVIERAVNRAQYPAHQNPRGRAYVKTKVLQGLGRIAVPPALETRPSFVPQTPAEPAFSEQEFEVMSREGSVGTFRESASADDTAIYCGTK